MTTYSTTTEGQAEPPAIRTYAHVCDDPLNPKLGQVNWADYACGDPGEYGYVEVTVYVSTAPNNDPTVFIDDLTGISWQHLLAALPQLNALAADEGLTAAVADWEARADAECPGADEAIMAIEDAGERLVALALARGLSLDEIEAILTKEPERREGMARAFATAARSGEEGAEAFVDGMLSAWRR